MRIYFRDEETGKVNKIINSIEELKNYINTFDEESFKNRVFEVFEPRYWYTAESEKYGWEIGSYNLPEAIKLAKKEGIDKITVIDENRHKEYDGFSGCMPILEDLEYHGMRIAEIPVDELSNNMSSFGTKIKSQRE